MSLVIPVQVKSCKSSMIKLCDNLLKAKKTEYVVNTKDLLRLVMESIMVLENVSF